MTKPRETWTQRKAHMQPQASHMEQQIRVRLTTEGISFLNDVQFCLERTVPDLYFPRKHLAVYLDGSVHLRRQDRDEVLREKLTRYHGVTVVSIPYKGRSRVVEDEVYRQVKEALEGG